MFLIKINIIYYCVLEAARKIKRIGHFTKSEHKSTIQDVLRSYKQLERNRARGGIRKASGRQRREEQEDEFYASSSEYEHSNEVE